MFSHLGADMVDNRSEDVEDLRRELASLVVDWAGRMVKDDPASPLGQALTSAVREAAKGAVVEQYQALARKDAEHIADAVDQLQARRADAATGLGLSARRLAMAGAAVAAALVAAFLLGLSIGRASPPSSPAPAADLIEPASADVYLPQAQPEPEPEPESSPAPPSAAAEPPARPVAATRPVPQPRQTARARGRERMARAAPADTADPVARPPVNPNAGAVPVSADASPAAAASPTAP